ncbi:hypothetical protein Lser_V15G25342 [Lactuca serriola]
MLSKSIAVCSSIVVKRITTSFENETDLIRYAHKLFNHMPNKHDTFINNTMMATHLSIQHLGRRGNFKLDGYMFLTLGNLCTSTLDVRRIHQVHEHVVKEGFGHNLFVAKSLVDMYVKPGQMNYAQKLFDEMLERSQVSWIVLVGGYAKCGDR